MVDTINRKDKRLWDSSSVVHKNKKLSTILDDGLVFSNKKTKIGKTDEGKDVFLIIVDFTMSDQVNTPKKIASLNFDKIFMFTCMFTDHTDYLYPFPFSYNNEGVTMYFSRQDGCVYEQHNYTYANNRTGRITAIYTEK